MAELDPREISSPAGRFAKAKAIAWPVLRSARNVALSVAAFMLVGNLVILGASAVAKRSDGISLPERLPGVSNVVAVDENVWRGAAPSHLGYRSLAERGVRTVVDLRAEEWVDVDAAYLKGLGIDFVRIPVRDGQVPTPSQVQRFMNVVNRASGRVYVHCGAGVGRTGSMAAAYLVNLGRDPTAVLRQNLAVGPPSLEQIAWVAALEPGDVPDNSWLVTAVSRLLDGPRRIWHRLGF